jgi:hypothetical protein
LMRDFRDEIPGYLNNRAICRGLESLSIKSGANYLSENLRRCYEWLVNRGILGNDELALLDAWLGDVSRLGFSGG